MTWASRRKSLYLGVSLTIILFIALGVTYAFFSRLPSCTDGLRNGDEQGIDCGGVCEKLCRGEARAPTVLWSRAFEVAPGLYSAAAYLENPNAGAYARNARYVFKLFDDNNVLIAERESAIDLPTQRIISIVETNIGTGSRIPVRTFFEFIRDISWEKAPTAPQVRVTGTIFDERSRRLEASVVNEDMIDVTDINASAVLFDAEGTARAASKSKIARLRKGRTEQIVFTWPTVFPDIVRSEIILLIPKQ